MKKKKEHVSTNKKSIILVLIFILAGISITYLNCCREQKEPLLTQEQGHQIITPDPLNASFTLDGQKVQLSNGKEEKILVDTAAKQLTQYVTGQMAFDLNADGSRDALFFVSQNNGGSGTFYYLAASISGHDAYSGTNAVFIGDRIEPKNITFANEQITVIYLDRLATEPMSASPSVERTKLLRLNGSSLEKVTVQTD